MLWALLATAIMALSGEGDDTVYFEAFDDAMTKAITEIIKDEARKQQALQALSRLESGFIDHRKGLEKSTSCMSAVDQKYNATPADYARCATTSDVHWTNATDNFVTTTAELQNAFSDTEWQQFEAKVKEEVK